MRPDRALDGTALLRLKSGLQLRLGNLAAALGLVAAAAALGGLSIGIGVTSIGPTTLLEALTGSAIGQDQAFALWTVRLPHILIGFMAGWSVALSGAMLQSLARNPLADPGLLGLSQGSMVTILVLLLAVPSAPLGLVPLAAIVGGVAVAGLLIGLTSGGRGDGLAILLMGIALESALSSVTSILILYTPPETSYAVSDWMAGSLFQASWAAIAALAPWFALSLPAILLIGRTTPAYDLGDEMAMAIGEPVRWSKPVILLVAVLLTSTAVTAVGPLVFLGVMAPHLAEGISRAFGRARLILSGLMGGLLVVAADALTRALASDIALPVGTSVTVIGVPLFVISLRLRALRRLQAQ
ncbi:FecCD family ABC transporter permease [Consotaella aegiceratis]|uniref:FecCD family ABC transporter permease n=1 Tax=Consotaella aegiceratis TaxID=3097961 RepID=UPI002F3E4FD8